jgi:hypothetical protein
MLLGDMNSLAEVGIGLNVAFGAMKSLRDWLLMDAQGKARDEQARIDALFAEEGSFKLNRENKARAGEICATFERKTEGFETRFTVVAGASASVLVAFLLCSSWHAQTTVSDFHWAFLVLILAIGPSGTWSGWLVGFSWWTQRALKKHREKIESLLAAMKAELEMNVEPTAPDANGQQSSNPPS